ncbi:hypothetical protein [Mycoplasmopsis glycophila]|uniref:Uncharacterized protein n=1 Tax=Mycoplasmopsis glycophila TaxID=171285 RepID=A0A449AVC0_9BACT|nr:hypothetical protein [Mycoplasmopsis glycophila]VEU70431.1 Uncharacterised protein [Mycoplasmopsis glycophila]
MLKMKRLEWYKERFNFNISRLIIDIDNLTYANPKTINGRVTVLEAPFFKKEVGQKIYVVCQILKEWAEEEELTETEITLIEKYKGELKNITANCPQPYRAEIELVYKMFFF